MHSAKILVKEHISNFRYVFTWIYMFLYWGFFALDFLFVIMKYGPYHDNLPGRCYTFDIGPDCAQFYWYCVQLIVCVLWIAFLFILPCCTCTCRSNAPSMIHARVADEDDEELHLRDGGQVNAPNERARCIQCTQPLGLQIRHRYLNCNELAFPLVILFALTLIEIALAITKNNGWYTVQILIDMFGYVIWFVFVFVPPTVIREFAQYFFFNNNSKLTAQQICVLRVHIPFMMVVMAAFLWMMYSVFGEDFNFEIIDGNLKLVFAQILLENVLILEWIHFVIEDLVFHPADEPVSYAVLHQNNEEEEEADEDEKKEPEDEKKEVLTNWWILVPLLLHGVATAIIVLIKLLETTSNFQMFHGEYSDIMHWIWIVQPVESAAVFAIIFGVLFQDPQQAQDLRFSILWFPALLFLALFITETIFGFWVNPWYFVHIITDLCGYFVFFVFALCFVRYIYSGNDELKDLNQCHMTVIRLLNFLYLGVGIVLILRNLEEDLSAAREAVHAFEQYDPKLVTALAFIQIILENALLIEFFHVLTHKLSADKYARNIHHQ